MTLLEVRSVSKIYGSLTALSKVDLNVAENEFHGLIGPNGSGKTTMLKCLAGAEIPTLGKVHLAGKDVTTLSPQERSRFGLSLKFQITAIFPELAVYDNMLIALQAHQTTLGLLLSRSKNMFHDEVIHYLDRFHLHSRQYDLAGELSHGQQQWLEIAMSLALKPRLLLLDEPTAGMSSQERRVTAELLAPIKEVCSLLIVEHDLDFIKDICDSLTVLDQGQVIASGPAKQVQNDPRVKEVYLANV